MQINNKIKCDYQKSTDSVKLGFLWGPPLRVWW